MAFEIITIWNPVLFLISAGIAIAFWAWANKRKARLDINKATNLFWNAATEMDRFQRRIRKGKGSELKECPASLSKCHE